jgi:hypothetical protein
MTAGRKLRFALSKTKLRVLVTRYRHRDIAPSDVFIASYPRSGSTWLRFVLQEVLTGLPSSFQKVNEQIPRVGFHERAYRLADGGRVIQTHEAFRPEYKRAVYLVRDPRDVLLSEFAYQKALGQMTDRLDSYVNLFVRGELSRYGSWRDHAASWLDASRANERIRIVRFEDLRKDTEAAVRAILEFLGVHAQPEAIRAAVLDNTIDRMRAKELKEPQAASKRGEFVRSGQAGGWRKSLGPEHARVIESWSEDILRRLDYPLAEKAAGDMAVR